MSEIHCPEDNSLIWSPVTNEDGAVSRLLSDFEEVRVLGSGGFGLVILAKSKIDHQHYAVKKIMLEPDNGYSKAVREVVVMAELCHPNVIRYHTSWMEAGPTGIMIDPKRSPIWNEKKGPLLCIQLELCKGGNLSGLMDVTTLTDKQIWQIFKQLMEAVEYIHAKSVRHGDISPNNIFFDSSNTLKLADFGFFLSAPERILPDGEFPPDTVYCAPELKTREKIKKISLKSDIYSAGIILLELLAKYPQDSSSRPREMSEFVKSGTLPESLSDMNEHTVQLINLMTNKNPNERPDARFVLTSILRAEEHLPVAC